MRRHYRITVVDTAAILMVIGALISLPSCADVQSRRAATESRPASAPAASTSLGDAAAGGESAGSKVSAQFVDFQVATDAPRRIIYEAEISLVVKKMEEIEDQIPRLLKQYNGYIAEAAVDRRQGEELTGRWRVRIPAPQFDSFLNEISKLGIAENRRQTAQDVTEEFIDLEAQISNKKKLEARIVTLLTDSSGKIKDIIEVERELARVRGEIEQMEGRLRYLTNRTDLTTVSIEAREEENYVPPAAPSFSNRISQAWSSSLTELRLFGERSAVAFVFAFPWLAIFGLIAAPVTWYVRKKNALARGLASADKQPVD